MSTKSWDSYYREYKGLLLQRHRLNIYLRDSREVISHLHLLGYKEAYFAANDPFFEQFLECGKYCFTTTFEEEDEEKEVSVIEIQHQPPRIYISRVDTGLCFMHGNTEASTSKFVEQSFGFVPDMIHSVCLFEGQGHYSEVNQFKINQ